MTDEQLARNKAIVTRFNAEFIQRGDAGVFEESVAADFLNYSAPPEAQGKAATFFWFTQVLRPAFPDLVVTIHDQVAEADTVVTRKSYAGTHSAEFFGVPATGKRVDFPMIDIIRLVDAQYVEHWSTVDLFGMMRQLNS